MYRGKDTENKTPIIISSFDPTKNTFKQYSTIIIPYKIWQDINSTFDKVDIAVKENSNPEVIKSFDIASSWSTFQYSANTSGTVNIRFRINNIELYSLQLNITMSDAVIAPVTEHIVLHLTS
jgi:hypothetical protein